MRITHALLLGGLLVQTACNSNNEQKQEPVAATNTAPAQAAPVQSKLGEAGTQALTATLAAYYQLKDAMVATDQAKAKEAAGNLAVKADSMKAIASRTPGNDSVVAYMDTVILNSKAITTLSDPECEKQRIAFEPVSNAMYRTVKIAELKNANVYHQYCPMAFNDKGAYWLSNVADIKNPYFGKKMLECGEVTDSL